MKHFWVQENDWWVRQLTKTQHRCPHQGCILLFQFAEPLLSQVKEVNCCISSSCSSPSSQWTILDGPDRTWTPHSLITQYPSCNIKQTLIRSTGELRGTRLWCSSWPRHSVTTLTQTQSAASEIIHSQHKGTFYKVQQDIWQSN